MSSVNARSLRDELDACKAEFDEIRAAGTICPRRDALIIKMLTLMNFMVVVFLEKITRKTSGNSSIPPSQMDDKDNTATRPRGHDKPDTNDEPVSNLRKVTVEETAPVEECENCGADLSGVEPVGGERRTLYDIVFEVVETHVDAEIKHCPDCQTRNKGTFPDTMPGPLQYGIGIMTFVINLLVAQMLSLRRAATLVQAITGRLLSEATLLGFVRRLHEALQPWEEAAAEKLLASPVLHADETGFRVDGKTHWIHVLTDGTLTLKFLHRKRGREAIDAIGLIPRYTGVLIHDCWASYFIYENCKHALCGSHLLRELTFIVESNGYRWARLIKKLLRVACHEVNRSDSKTLSDDRYRAIRRRYRTILALGSKEMPEIPERRKGQRGRLARSDAHNLHDRLARYEEEVLRFACDPHTSYTNNTGERAIRMAKVKLKVSGCFRTRKGAEEYCRVSSYLQSMEAKGYNTLIAIAIALKGDAAKYV